MPKRNIVECSDLNTADPSEPAYHCNEHGQKFDQNDRMIIELGSSPAQSEEKQAKSASYFQDDVWHINLDPPQPPRKRKKTKLSKGDIKVKPLFDIKQTKQHIIQNWARYDPEKIVLAFGKYYKNLRSCAVMLSRFKKQLAGLKPPPPADYLKQIALTKKQYNQIRQISNEVRQKEALGVKVIANADAIVQQAMKYITSSDPKLLLAGIFPLTGLRPIGVAKIATFTTRLNNEVERYSEYWACQKTFAKRRATGFNDSRDRCFLVPFWLIERALEIIRKRWPCENLTSLEVNRKYASHWGQILRRAYPMFPGVTAKLCRRFFVAYAYPHFKKQKTVMSLNAFASHMLGHVCLDSQVIAYSSLCLDPVPTLDIFGIGRTLRITT